MASYIPLLSALFGALIGAATSVVTIIVQAHYQNKREMTKEAITLALADWKTRLALISENGGTALLLAVFVQYHSKLIHLAEQGLINPRTIRQLNTDQEQLIMTLEELRNDRKKQGA